MTGDSERHRLVAEVDKLMKRAKELGFLQTREILIVALNILSQEEPLRKWPVVCPLRVVRDDVERFDPDWSAKEGVYFQQLIDAQHLPDSH